MSKPAATVLADTNVVSELTRPAANAGVREWSGAHARIAVSSITISEIVFGFEARPNPKAANQFEAVAMRVLDLLPVTEEIARRAGVLRGRLQRQGRVRTLADMLIAATALVHDLTLVTRNTRDFEGCGLRIINPFQ